MALCFTFEYNFMNKHNAELVNAANLSPKGSLGKLFLMARKYNHINDEISPQLPNTISSIRLSIIVGNTATFVAPNQPVAYKANQQKQLLLDLLKTIDGLSHVDKVVIKVDYI